VRKATVRNRFQHILPVLDYLGPLLWVNGFILLAPLIILGVGAGRGDNEVPALGFIVPSALSLSLGFVLKRKAGFRSLDSRGAMLLCASGWIAVSAIGALPFYLGLGANYLDSFFEAVSGFTTTGITMFSGLDAMPRSILFWRALSQWMGGLGILAFFLSVVSGLSSAHALFSAESAKIFSKRPAPSLFHTLRILWTIYGVLTVIVAVLLFFEGVSLFDAICHSLTSIATGGFSTHDLSIGYYREAGFPHYVLIEYTIVLAMLAGGLNFLIHYRVATGGIRALWDNTETRLYWLFLAGAVLLVGAGRMFRADAPDVADTLRSSVFHVVSVMTTTGFVTRDIGGDYFPALAKQVFLVLMVVGGCVGSTSGGFKVLRIGVLFQMVRCQVRRVVHGPSAVNLVTIDGEQIEPEEISRVGALFFAWMMLLAIGSAATALLTSFGALESASGMFSALCNIGPCYISVGDMMRLTPALKIIYIVGMLAGRLEILPILLLFSRRTWR